MKPRDTSPANVRSHMRLSRGLPVPSLWGVLALVATVCGSWLLWSEYRQRAVPRSAEGPNLSERIRSIEARAADGVDALPEFLEMLASSDAKTRGDGLLGLIRLGADARPALQAVRERLTDDDSRVRDNALIVFAQICDDETERNSVAARLLLDADGLVRESAAATLRAGGPPVIPILIGMRDAAPFATRGHILRL